MNLLTVFHELYMINVTILKSVHLSELPIIGACRLEIVSIYPSSFYFNTSRHIFIHSIMFRFKSRINKAACRLCRHVNKPLDSFVSELFFGLL